MRRPFTISEKYRTYKGKKVKFFQYSINESSGLPEYVCKNHYRKTIHAKNKTEANMMIMALIEELKKSNGEHKHTDTFGDYSKDWMIPGSCPWEKYVSSEGRRLSASYMNEYRKIYENHVADDHLLARRPISQITRADLIRYRERLNMKLGVCSTSRKAFKITKQCLKYAAMMGDIPHDPTAGLGDIKDKSKPRGIVTMDEITEIFPPGERGPWLDDQDRLAFFLAYSLGLRRGEVLGLHWRDLYSEKKQIHIVEALVEIERRMGDPKKGKIRWCPIPKSTLKMLEDWKGKTRFPNPDDFVFCYQKRHRHLEPGHNFSGTWWSKRFRKAMDKLEIDRVGRNIVPHSLRHSINTHLQDLGYSRRKLRETFGWSEVETQDIYTHAEMMDHSEQAELTESILSKIKEK